LDFTEDQFNDLLSWLDPQPAIAAQKYKTIHTSLVRIFVSRGFSNPEHLADLTIDRVIKILPQRRENFVGEKARLFYSVARYIMLEEDDQHEVPLAEDVLPSPAHITVTSEEYECLCHCLKELTPGEIAFLHDYHVYDGEGRLKIENHESMKEELDLEGSSMRVKANRIRARLRECALRRMEALRVKRNTSRLALVESEKGIHGPTRER